MKQSKVKEDWENWSQLLNIVDPKRWPSMPLVYYFKQTSTLRVIMIGNNGCIGLIKIPLINCKSNIPFNPVYLSVSICMTGRWTSVNLWIWKLILDFSVTWNMAFHANDIHYRIYKGWLTFLMGSSIFILLHVSDIAYSMTSIQSNVNVKMFISLTS